MQDPVQVSSTTPLRLSRVVEIVWPKGGVTVSGLRREAAKGRLQLTKLNEPSKSSCRPNARLRRP